MPIAKKETSQLLPREMNALIAYALLAISVFLAYANIYDNVFLFDDDLIITGNTYLTGWSHIWDILTSSTTSGVHIVGGFYRPVQILLYLFAWHLGDGSTFWFHFLNIALHVANTCFVYRLGTKLGFDWKPVFLAALVWGVHPLHVEAVTYMSGTADLLFSFFCLWGVIALLPDFTARKIWKALPLFVLAILSKETAVCFPLLVSACLFYVSTKRLSPSTYFRTWPLWVISLIYAYWRAHDPNFDGPQTYERFYQLAEYSPMGKYAHDPLLRIYTFLATLPDYLSLLIWPTNLHMERTFAIQMTGTTGPVMWGALTFALASAHIVYSCRIKRGLEMSWGLLWFAAAHAPDTGLLIAMNSLFLEHWMYLPAAGLFLGTAQTGYLLVRKLPRLAPVACATTALAFALVLSAKTYAQNEVWRNPVTFYSNIFAHGEKSARSHNNLALYYASMGKLDDAITQFNEAIKLSDAYAETRYNLAATYLRRSQDKDSIDKAVEQLNRSIEIQPNFYRSYQMLGELYDKFYNDKEKADFYRAKGAALFNRQR